MIKYFTRHSICSCRIRHKCICLWPCPRTIFMLLGKSCFEESGDWEFHHHASLSFQWTLFKFDCAESIHSAPQFSVQREHRRKPHNECSFAAAPFYCSSALHIQPFDLINPTIPPISSDSLSSCKAHLFFPYLMLFLPPHVNVLSKLGGYLRICR